MINVSEYKRWIQKTPKPFAFVNIDAFDQNLKNLQQRCGKKQIRVATKSIRSVYLLKRIAEKASINRWMCFKAEEALYLSSLGFNNLLVAYPTTNPKSVQKVCAAVKKGKQIILMTDTQRHLQQLNAIAQKNDTVLPIAMDVDVSYLFGGIYFGVYRSSICSYKKIDDFLSSLKKYPYLKLTGVMTYEAQIAGVGDAQKNAFFKNKIISFLKWKSQSHIKKQRKNIEFLLQKHQIKVDFINGGGTGSLETTAKDKVITEVTFGSGLFQSALFDNYKHFSHLPATGFVLEICRHPRNHIYTCLGGGYIASGSIGKDKLPTIVYPKRASLFKNEGAGEVQTPFYCQKTIDLKTENFAILRHAKAGELCERFNELHLLSQGENIGKITTYRGDGNCFL